MESRFNLCSRRGENSAGGRGEPSSLSAQESCCELKSHCSSSWPLLPSCLSFGYQVMLLAFCSFILAKMVFLHDTVVSPRMMKCSAGIPILPGRFIPVLHRLGLGEPAAGQRLYSAPSGCLPALLSLPTPPFAS